MGASAMKNKTIALGLLAAAAAGVFSLAGAELAAGPVAAAQDLDGATPRQAIRSRGINFHEYGIRVAVEKPLTPSSRIQRIVVQDLGPDVMDLQDDRIPGSAVLRVNGRPPIPLHFSRPGFGFRCRFLG